jgi:hypothetical protein
MIIEWGSKPAGWTITPASVTTFMASGAYYNAQFSVTPPGAGGNGQIEWRFLDDDLIDDLLDTEWQTVTANPQPPGAPGRPDLNSTDDTGYSAVDNITSRTNGLTLSWAPAQDPIGAGPLGYEWRLDSSVWNWNGSATGVDIAATEGVHNFSVRAVNIFGVPGSATNLQFQVDASSPSSPSLLLPQDGVSACDQTVFLDWSAEGDAGSGVLRYEVQVDDFNTFASPVWTSQPASSSTTTPVLNYGRYYWRVRAEDQAGNFSTWSSVCSFIVECCQVRICYPWPGDSFYPGELTEICVCAQGCVSACPPYQYSIYLNGVLLVQGQRASLGGECFPVAMLAPGNYLMRVRVMDACGNTWWSYDTSVVILNSAPVITQQPRHQTVFPTHGATFTVSLTGATPLSYQWRRDGTNPIGPLTVTGSRTATLTLTNLQAFDAGGYSVVVTNNYGAVTSTVAGLTVEARPLLTAVGLTTNGMFRVSVLGLLDQAYVLQCSSDFTDWTPIATNGSTGNFADLFDPGPMAPRRFFRVLSFPQR